MPYAPLDNGQLWYDDAGGDGTPVVFVHGIAGNSEAWYQQWPAFTEAGLRMITYDLRSSGRSQPAPGREGGGTIADDLDALVTHLGLSKFVLVTQAYGAFGGLEYGLDYGDKLQGLVVTNSMGGVVDFEAERARIVATTALEDRELGRTYRAANPEGVARFMAIEHHNDPPPTRQSLRAPMTLSRLEGMRVPTLMVSSDEDVFAPPPLMQQMADRIPGCQFAVIEGAGHCAYWEQPAAWNALVIGFINLLRHPNTEKA